MSSTFHSISLSELFILLEKKEATLITANTRLMQYFQDLYFKNQLAEQCTVIESPNIFSYDLWLDNCWKKQNLSSLTLIQHQQSHFLWEEVIEKNNPSFFNAQGIVEAVKKAWKLCWAWNIEISEKNFSVNIDTATFFQWASSYKKILDENHWVDKDMLPVVLREMVEDDVSRHNIILTGFDRLSPSITELVNALSLEEPRIYKNIKKSQVLSKIAFLSDEEEIHAFLSWTKNQSKDETINNIACVVPNLNEKRNKLDRLIQRYFHEDEVNISAGNIFSTCSMIAPALKMFSIKKTLMENQQVTLKDFYFILESRYLGEAEEEKRSQANKALHATENAQLSWKSFLVLLNKNQVTLVSKLEAFEHFFIPENAKPSEWTEVFQTLLEILGWPGAYILDSVEYQTYERWLALLQEYRQLDLIFNIIPFKKALLLLRKMADRVIFQANKKNARIHFLGVLEAAGLHFDRLWITGMNADQFPGNVQLNPFIPSGIQRQYELPHATHEVERAFSEELMQHFMAGGDEVIFSYASQKKGIKIGESVLIHDIPLRVNPLFPVVEETSISLDIFYDRKNFPRRENEQIRGGTSLIKNQALCPFRAFAKHRLQSIGFEKLTLGLNDHERGSLVHDALEKFWNIAQTQQQLLAYTSEELDKLINKTAFQTVKNFIQSAPQKADKLPPFFQKLEIKRLEQLLKKWLAIEKERPSFSIISLEESNTIKLSDLELKIRVDRIDQLANGDKMVIDYKTGLLPPLSSEDERPENPQLLLYALADPEVKAWAFAQVKAAEPLFKGKSADETNIAGIKAIDWDAERQQWEQTLLALAEEFLQGEHKALPKKEVVCNTCDLHGLCRIRDL